jgi:hypothetical protein
MFIVQAKKLLLFLLSFSVFLLCSPLSVAILPFLRLHLHHVYLFFSYFPKGVELSKIAAIPILSNFSSFLLSRRSWAVEMSKITDIPKTRPVRPPPWHYIKISCRLRKFQADEEGWAIHLYFNTPSHVQLSRKREIGVSYNLF